MRHLELALPDGATVSGAVDLGGAMTVSIYGRDVPAHIVEGPWAEALSAVAERPVRLVRFDDPGEGVDRADEGAGASLLSEDSLRAIASAAGVTGPVDPRRFRMLFGVSGVDAHAEDTWIGTRVQIALQCGARREHRSGPVTTLAHGRSVDLDTLEHSRNTGRNW